MAYLIGAYVSVPSMCSCLYLLSAYLPSRDHFVLFAVRPWAGPLVWQRQRCVTSGAEKCHRTVCTSGTNDGIRDERVSVAKGRSRKPLPYHMYLLICTTLGVM